MTGPLLAHEFSVTEPPMFFTAFRSIMPAKIIAALRMNILALQSSRHARNNYSALP
jgi:hypothetical protein